MEINSVNRLFKNPKHMQQSPFYPNLVISITSLHACTCAYAYTHSSSQWSYHSKIADSKVPGLTLNKVVIDNGKELYSRKSDRLDFWTYMLLGL